MAEFETEAEAIAAANASEFGLGGAVISADLERCKRVGEALQCGIVWINCSQPCFCQVRAGCQVWCGCQMWAPGAVVGARCQVWVNQLLATLLLPGV